MKTLLLITCMLASTLALADMMVRINGRLISTGDSVGHVVRVAGQPDRIVQLENRFGAVVGERWVYYIGGYNPKTITITIADGQVQSVSQQLGD